MDSSIRGLLLTAQQFTGNGQNQALLQAFNILHTVSENRTTSDDTEAFNSDLYVLCAETAFQFGLREMAKECLKMFFMKPPPTNQFLCRAYLCQAQILAPDNANDSSQLEKAVVYIVKAITLAKTNQRYHFIVYNASVLYWQFCRPFLKPGYKQHLAHSLHQIVKALDDIEDKDYEWRAQLMIALIECHLDAGRRSDASHIATASSTFIKQNVPAMFKQLFGLMVCYQLVESSKLHKDIKTSPELSVYYKVCKIKLSLEQKEQKDYFNEIQSILNQMGVSVQQVIAQTGTSGDRISRKDSKQTAVRDSSSSLTLQTNRDEDTPTRKSASKTGRRTPTPTSSKKLAVDSNERPYLLLEVARLSSELDFPSLAQACIDNIKLCTVKDQTYYLELEFLECEMMVKTLGQKQESYIKPIIDTRVQAMKRCEEAILNAVRLGDPNIIQVGCVTQWNLSLPLQQSNLRSHIRKHLTVIAEALENINSLLIQLRCQVHTELSRCEEDGEQIQVAMQHLKKALALDDGDLYKERLEVALHRLELRSELYNQPDRPEDQAAMIIEQARNCDSGTMRMKRSLLVKAGEALSPDAFLLVLDSESETRDMSTNKGPQTITNKLASKAQQFNKCVKKAEGHIKRLGDENDRERARLWADLAKTARKHEVWDVCRVAARFALLYDDDRWKTVRAESPNTEKSREVKESREDGAVSELEKKSTSRISSRPVTPESTLPLYNKDLLRILAEINFIQGEAFIHLLRSEKVELNNAPIPPEDTRKRPKGYVAKKPEEDPDWLEYCDWIKALSDSATKSFLRGLELGVIIDEAWLVCSAAAYIWNYNNHILTDNRHREIMETLTTVLDGLKKVGHAGETVMLVNICNSLAISLIQPWIPVPPAKELQEPAASPSPVANKKGTRANMGTAKSKAAMSITISPDAMPDLKKAIEVCDYGLQVTSGDNILDIVPITIRQSLLQTWVTVKQMALQQISKSLGTEDETNMEGQRGMTKAIVAVEMFSLSRNGIMEFKDVPNLNDIAQLVENCKWSEKFVELQLWTKLTYLSFIQKLHPLVVKCSEKALRFVSVGTQPKNRKMEPHRYIVEQEMLSYSSSILGQSLIENMNGKNSIRRQAMDAFLNGARYARNAKNYDLVISSTRHYWNACVSLVNQPIERELLKEPVRVLLQCITATSDIVKKEDKTSQQGQGDISGGGKDEDLKKSRMVGSQDDDLSLRAALYGVLFQAYADKGEWQESLVAMDQAISDMPRTKHRLLIFKHRVMVKARLGQDVQMDIQKFKDESEDYVAYMWRRVALSSQVTSEQLSSYQNAIEALTTVESDWLKIDYLLEFAQWSYVNQFPIDDCIDQIEWAIDILLNMQYESPLLKKEGLKKDKKKGKLSGKKVKTPELETNEAVHVIEETKSKSVHDNVDKEINPEEYVPIVKEADIGVLPNNNNLCMDDLTDLQQLDYLFRAHVILSQIHGRDSPQYIPTLLMAYGFLHRIWQISVTSSSYALKELAKNPITETAMSGKNSAKAKGKKDKEKEPLVKEKPKRKGPLDVLPTCSEEWSVYDVPDEVLEAFKHESMKKLGINIQTLTKPLLTSHYLDELTEELRALGYNHLTLPLFAFQDMLARSLFNNKAMSNLAHLKSLEVCYELDLKAGCSFHEKLINMDICEEEQAQSREEIALWKEKQVQVAREEMRVKETLSRLANEGKIEKRTIMSKTNMTPSKEDKNACISHIGKVLSGLSMREVWTNTAEVLVRLGYNQNAREYLNEANMAAEAFEDKDLQVHILYILAQLAYNEAQYGQCYNLCKAAQELKNNDEMFWFKSTMLIVESTLKDYENKNNRRVARQIVVHALNQFNEILKERPNRISTISYIMSSLEAKLACIQSDILLSGDRKSTVPKVMQGLLSACEKFENSIENMLKLGYNREAIPYIKEHSKVLKHIADEAIEPEITHTYLLQSLNVCKEGVSVCEEVFSESLAVYSLQDTRCISLPIQRQLVDMQLTCGRILIDILKLQTDEGRQLQLENERKGSVLLMVEDYIRQTPKYTHMEKDWYDIKQSAGEEAISLLVNSHSLAGNIISLKAESLLWIGTCLHLLGQSSNPNSPSQWIVQQLEGLKSNEEEEDQTEDIIETKQTIKYSQEIRNKQNLHDASRFYLLQACECLLQSLNLSLNNKLMPLASSAALELVNLIGQYDHVAASQLLALYQSCNVSVNGENLLQRAQLDPTTSKLAALLHQRHTILTSDIQTNLSSSSLMTTVHTSLEKDWQAWKRLEVLNNHSEILKEFPPNFNFIILQHSPDRKFLYGSLLDRPKAVSGGGGGKGGKQQTTTVPGRAKVFGIETSAERLNGLLDKFRSHKQSVQQLLLKQEYQRTQAALRNKMLKNIDNSIKQEAKVQTSEDELEESRLNNEFRQLVQDMGIYLNPIMSPIQNALWSSASPHGSIANLSKEPKDSSSNPECIILLVDHWLLEMPLEAMECLQSHSIASLSRDFSLQMFYHRFHQEVIPDESGGDKNKKKAKDAAQPMSRIPGAREAKQKQGKIVPLDRPILPWQYSVDTMNFKYMVDCYDDCAETEENKPVILFNHLLEEYEQQFTPRWLGLSGEEHSPSIGEWEVYLNESSSFIFYGMERLMSYIPPAKLSALNIPECAMIYCLDLTQTNKSFLRQSKIDILKSHNALSLEKPVETAMLTSLTGIKCLLANQWSCTLEENSDKLKVSLKDLLQKGKTTGQTVRLIMSPSKRASELKAETEDQEVTASPSGKSKDLDKHEYNTESPTLTEHEPDQPETEETPSLLHPSWFNLVCYGLPNLVVTQM